MCLSCYSMLLACTVYASQFVLTRQTVTVVSSNSDKIIVWSSDWHVGPVADIKHTLSSMTTEFIDQSVGHQCKLTSSCASNQSVYRSYRQVITQSPCRNRIIEHFYNVYRNDEQFNRVDLVLLTYSLGLSELYMPFNKSLAVIAHTRYEVGRHTAEEWTLFNDNLRRIAANPYNLVAANNLYDLEYMKYFTGIEPVLLPSACGYVNTQYIPTRTDILVAPYRSLKKELFKEISQLGNIHGLNFSAQSVLYPHYNFSDLARHPAVVFIPYQVSIMSIIEYYRMSVPLFFPDINLLYKWHLKYRLLKERTWYNGAGAWYGFRGIRAKKSVIDQHPNNTSIMKAFDPNDDFDKESIMEWLKLSDFYIWPHIIVFNSFEHLIELLHNTNMKAVSQQMKKYNRKQLHKNRLKWKEFLFKVRQGRNTRLVKLPYNVNDALYHSYRIKLDLESKKCYGLL